MSNYKISKTSLIALGIYLLLNFFFFSKTYRLSSSSQVIAFSPNGKMLATASGELVSHRISPNHRIHGTSSQVEIRKIGTGRIIQTFDFLSATGLAFSPDNSLVAVGGYGGEIKIWRINDQKLLYSFKDAEAYYFQTSFLSFSPDGKTLIARVGRSSLSVWDLNDGKKKYTLSKPYNCAASSPDGKLLALGGLQVPLTIYRADNGTTIRQIETPKGICSNLQFSADSELLIFDAKSGLQQGIHIHRVKDGKLLHLMSIKKPYRDRELLSDFTLSPDNRYLAASYDVSYESSIIVFVPSYPKALSGRIRIWNIENEKLVKTLWGHWKGTKTIEFSPNGKWLASAGKDSTIKLWRMPPINYRIGLLAALGLAAFIHWRRNQSRN